MGDDDMALEHTYAASRSSRGLTIDELASAHGVQPMVSTDEWAADLFESDGELEEFLADVRASRIASPA